MPSPSCPGSRMEFDCAKDTAELRCPECGVLFDVWPIMPSDYAFSLPQFRASLPNHPPRRN